MAKKKNGAKVKYQESKKVQRLYSDYDKLYGQYTDMLDNPGQYGYDAYRTGGKYAGIANLDELFEQVMNPTEFTYDTQTDPLFQMYKQQYEAQGNRAMQNQMGVASALSGGYNSSAAQTAAQNTYMGYMDALNEKAAETYQNALDMDKYKKEQLLNRYNVVKDMNDAANQAYWQQADTLGSRANNAYTRATDQNDFNYKKWSDGVNFKLQQQQNAQARRDSDRLFRLQQKLYKGK